MEMEQRQDLELNNELYVSLAYKIMIEKGMKIRVYDKIPHFCQWGTPEDLQDFIKWSDIFNKYHYGE